MASGKGELFVIGAGHGRTGTSSLKMALEKLYGAPCHHMKEVVGNSSRVQFWLDAFLGQKTRKDFREYFQREGFVCAVDAPSFGFWEELLQEYPDAKVVLSVRDPEKWYKSCTDTIFLLNSKSPLWGIRVFYSTIGRTMSKMQMALLDMWAGESGFCARGGLKDAEACKRLLVEWQDSVKRRCPKDKLLVWQASDGWEPLCKFLGKPVPDGPFPHENDTRAFRRIVNGIRTVGTVVGVVALPVVVATMWLFPVVSVQVVMAGKKQG